MKIPSTWRHGLAAICVAASGAMIPMSGVYADEADAKALLKAMSDYLAAQQTISFDYDAVLEVVTKEGQKIGLASSGTVSLSRPDRIRAARAGGFADIEMLFDGAKLTMLGKNANMYTQIAIAGTIDDLVDELRDKYGRPLPGADLIISNPYDALMSGVSDVKDLGSGVIGGVECDSLAFRTDGEVDWQIWIAHGDRPYPCRYAITTKGMEFAPQYSIQIRAWRTGDEVAKDDFAFEAPDGAKEIAFEELRGKLHDLPENFKTGDK